MLKSCKGFARFRKGISFRDPLKPVLFTRPFLHQLLSFTWKISAIPQFLHMSEFHKFFFIVICCSVSSSSLTCCLGRLQIISTLNHDVLWCKSLHLSVPVPSDLAVLGANFQLRGYYGSDARGRKKVWHCWQLLERHNGRGSKCWLQSFTNVKFSGRLVPLRLTNWIKSS